MKILCVLGEHQYGSERLGIGTEFAAFLPALRSLGHEVVHFESWDRSRYQSFSELNLALLAAVEREKPDVMLAVHQLYELWTETLDILKERAGLTTINWCTDDSWKYRQVSRFIGRHYHAMATTHPDAIASYRRDGIANVCLTQWAANEDQLQAPLPAAACKHAVSFVGAAHGDRKARVERLRRLGFKVECFGAGWPHGPVPAQRIPQIMRDSFISLNFANSSGANQLKARTFEVPGAGGFLLTEDAPHLDAWYVRGEEVEVFADDAELVEKLRYYTARPDLRDRIAAAGHARTRREHTYRHRLQAVLASALEAREAPRSAAGDRPGSVPGALPGALPADARRMGWALSTLRSATLAACRLIWGAQRGSRAARRLTFELSWRFAGDKTFSAEGWPGRMYYDHS